MNEKVLEQLIEKHGGKEKLDVQSFIEELIQLCESDVTSEKNEI